MGFHLIQTRHRAKTNSFHPLFFSQQWWDPLMALPCSLQRNLLKLDLLWLMPDLVVFGLGTIRQCLIHLAVILSICHPANCAFLLWVLPSLVKGQKLVSFFVTPITWQLNSRFSSHNLEAVVYSFVSGALQVSREGHADPSTKGTNCPVLINKSCPSVTFHSTLLPACEKQTQRTGKKVLLPREFAQSAHMMSGQETGPCPLEDWEHYEVGYHKMTGIAL